MPKSYDVVLPVSQRAKFPNKCAFTLVDSPTSQVTLVTRDGGYGIMLWAGWFAVRLPVTPAGRVQAIRSQCWALCRNICLVACCFGIVAVAISMGLSGFWPSLGGFGIICIVIVALVAWEQNHPPAMKVYRKGDVVYYEFRHEAYANEFAKLNSDDVTRPKGFLG